MSFVEYADTERPGIKLVSSKQVKVFLSDTTHGVVFFVTIHAISPSRITTNPYFRCKFSLGTNNAADGITFPIALPLQGPITGKDLAGAPLREYNFVSQLTYVDDSTATVTKSVDTNSIFPLKTLQGTIYFEVTKTKEQRVFSQEVEIY